MVHIFSNQKNHDLGKFWRKMLVKYMVIWYILRSFGIFFAHLV
jgi:hypothetical protein